jgi:hypothetical protein
MTPLGQDRERLAAEERERIRRAFPQEFADGAKRAFSGDKLYPFGFLGWTLDRRNAWFAGFNKGYFDRKRAESGDAG